MAVSVSSPVSFISSSSQPSSNRLISVPPLKSAFNGNPLSGINNQVCFSRRLISSNNNNNNNNALSIKAVVSTSTKKDDIGLVTREFTASNPLEIVCRSNTRITAKDATDDVRHIVFNTGGKLRFKEGQYIGVTPPEALHASYYSLASSTRGDFGDGQTASLCVLRVVDGVASNYLCDLKPGDAIKIIGPYGTDMLMPQDERATIIWLATSTGIASFRGYLWKMFKEKHDNYKFKGLSWLFFETDTSGNLLYQDEMKKIRDDFPKELRLDYAISEEQKNANGDKMYIQTRMAQHGEELWKRIKDDNTFVYMSGLASMEAGIDSFMTDLAKRHGHDWKHYKRDLKQEGRWNVEVY